MTRFPALLAPLGLAAGAALTWPGAAFAQSAGCELKDAGGGRQVLRCGGGVSAEVERGAEVRVIDANRDGAPEALDVKSRAVLVDYEGRGRRGFQILTPHAIAAVRGTTWAVDVEGGRTSVFVLEGQVAVGRAAAERGVVLRPGQGVDVDAGSGPLRATTWPRERATALLARFGR